MNCDTRAATLTISGGKAEDILLPSLSGDDFRRYVFTISDPRKSAEEMAEIIKRAEKSLGVCRKLPACANDMFPDQDSLHERCAREAYLAEASLFFPFLGSASTHVSKDPAVVCRDTSGITIILNPPMTPYLGDASIDILVIADFSYGEM